MKFRRLSIEELKELEGDFIQFLAANTVTGPDWEQLKTEQPDKAENLIELFSDIVFEKIIKGVNYLEFKVEDDIKTFHCLEDKIILNGIRIDGKTDIDLRDNLPPQEMMKRVHDAGAKMQVYSADKTYRPDREQELFRMLEAGAQISRDGMLFKAIEEFKEKLTASYPDIKIILLSMHDDEQLIAHLMKIVTNGYLIKNEQAAIHAVMEKGYCFNDYVSKAMMSSMQKATRKFSPESSLNNSVNFTQKELEILNLICREHTTAEIAKQLFFSHRTVESHRKNLLEKSGIRNMTGLVVYAMQNNLVDLIS